MIERAETGSRPTMTAEDQRRYAGIARHPLARRWLARRMDAEIEAADEAQANGDDMAESRHRLAAERVRKEARRLGFDMEGRGNG